MRAVALVVALALFAPVSLRAEAPAPRFRPVAIVIDSALPVAAWQLEVRAVSGDGSLVGVEGGEAPFDAPAWYDPAALTGGRIVLAAFTSAQVSATGRRRVAVLHLREAGEVTWTVHLHTAAGPDGAPMDAEVTLVPFEGGEP